MSFPQKRIELLVNIAIVVVALLSSGVLIKRYLLPVQPKPGIEEAMAGVKPGTKLAISGLDWSKSERTLLIVLSTTCKYCTESAPFYQRLAEQKPGRQDVRLIAVLPQSAGEAKQYLSDNHISVDDIAQTAPGATYARATPTLILVDKTGLIVESWVGKVPAEKEAEVMRLLFGKRQGT